jgi:hypothetical protein
MTSTIKPDVDISVRLTYKGSKAYEVDFRQFDKALAVLRADLGVLKLPLPKVENIVFLYTGCIQFYWRTHKGSVSPFDLCVRQERSESLYAQVVHRNLHTKILPQGENVTFDSILEGLSMYVFIFPTSK